MVPRGDGYCAVKREMAWHMPSQRYVARGQGLLTLLGWDGGMRLDSRIISRQTCLHVGVAEKEEFRVAHRILALDAA